MVVTTPGDKILITGANGFVASWLIREFLEHGYTVRGTVRSLDKANHLRKVFQDAVESGRLEFVEVPDFLVPDAFDEAVKGVDAIAHVATPLHANAIDPWGEFVFSHSYAVALTLSL